MDIANTFIDCFSAMMLIYCVSLINKHSIDEGRKKMDAKQLPKLTLSGILIWGLLILVACQPSENPTTARDVIDPKPNIEPLLADTVLINGKILTVDLDFSIVHALAMGDTKKIQEFIGSSTLARTDKQYQNVLAH